MSRKSLVDKLIADTGYEVLGWDGVTDSPGRFGSTVYRYGRREIGHVHDDGIVDLPFPKDVHDDIVSSGRASVHRAGLPGYVSYDLRKAQDVTGAIELFSMNYDRAVASAADRTARRKTA